MRYKINQIPGNRTGKEPDIRKPRGFRHTQRFTPGDPPCEGTLDKVQKGRCPAQIVFDKGQPYLMFCDKEGEYGSNIVPVNSVEDAAEAGRQICDCWDDTGDFNGCAVKHGGKPVRGRKRKLGDTKLDLDIGYGEPAKLGNININLVPGGRGFGNLRNKLNGTGGDDWISCRRVGKLTAAKKKKLPNKAFGLPELRSYPMPDPSHARNAKARAKAQLKKKRLNKKDYDRIVRKADRVIGKCKRRK
jgi:hypothetical protein